MSLAVFAENQGKRFDPQKFTKDQEAFITKEARLTQQEANAFFPIFREMQQKERALFKQQRDLKRKNPQNDKEAAQIINELDNIEMQMTKIKQQYHSKFCKAISPVKVLQCINAEEKFKHFIMGNIANMHGGGGPKFGPGQRH